MKTILTGILSLFIFFGTVPTLSAMDSSNGMEEIKKKKKKKGKKMKGKEGKGKPLPPLPFHTSDFEMMMNTWPRYVSTCVISFIPLQYLPFQGACIAQISCEEEMVINTLNNDEKQELERLLSNTKSKLLKNGASESSIGVLVKESIPLAYLPGAVKLKVKLCGDLVFWFKIL